MLYQNVLKSGLIPPHWEHKIVNSPISSHPVYNSSYVVANECSIFEGGIKHSEVFLVPLCILGGA